MTKARLSWVASLAAALLFTLACDLPALTNLGSDKAPGTVADLWPDVPRMDGLSKAQMDLPLVVRLAIQVFTQVTSEGGAKFDFIAFTTTQTAADIRAFYTLERMKAAGWVTAEELACPDQSGQVVGEIRLVCLFERAEGSAQTQLVMVAIPEEGSNRLQLFFIRLSVTPTPVPR